MRSEDMGSKGTISLAVIIEITRYQDGFLLPRTCLTGGRSTSWLSISSSKLSMSRLVHVKLATIRAYKNNQSVTMDFARKREVLETISDCCVDSSTPTRSRNLLTPTTSPHTFGSNDALYAYPEKSDVLRIRYSASQRQ